MPGTTPHVECDPGDIVIKYASIAIMYVVHVLCIHDPHQHNNQRKETIRENGQ